MTDINIGVLNEMTTKAPITTSKQSINIKNVLGSSPSIVLMSSENLLTMRPTGVVSKKDMGDRTMLYSIFWWRVREAMMVRYTKMICRATIKTAEKVIQEVHHQVQSGNHQYVMENIKEYHSAFTIQF